MPSMYNHENACWGIRRSPCDMFQYDLNKEFTTNKTSELACRSNQSTGLSNATHAHYSISSNGYYGYQPHQATQVVETNIEFDMDVEDMDVIPSNNRPITSCNPISLDCAAFHPDPQQNVLRRKRPMTGDSSDGSKRSRQEDCGGGWSVSHRRLEPSKVELLNHDDYESTTTLLLRQTHGCELYLFGRTCDY